MRANAESFTLFIVHWNRPGECAATVRGFREQERSLRVVIIDNNSRPENRAALPRDSAIAILPLAENKGWGPALNVALRDWLEHSTDEFCLLSAHDAEPGAECVAKLRRAMTENPRLAMACPQYPDHSVAHLSRWRGVHQQIAAPDAGVQLVDAPHGTLMMLRRAALAQIGLFDERYFAYGDEHELGARARRQGWAVGLVWGASVANPQTSTPSEWRSYLFTRNSLLLVRDYFGAFFASVRAFFILGKTIVLILRRRDDGFAFSARARWRGCRDYFAGRFGAPSFE